MIFGWIAFILVVIATGLFFTGAIGPALGFLLIAFCFWKLEQAQI